MPYSKFRLQDVVTRFGLGISTEIFFTDVKPLAYSDWLKEALERATKLGYNSGKERSERLIHPVLAELNVLNNYEFAVYSGRDLDIDKVQELVGECDFIFAFSETLDLLQAPIFMLMEAKEENMDAGIAQCAAQMMGAMLFNERENSSISTIYGCTTIGNMWRLMKLKDNKLHLDKNYYYIDNVGILLGALQLVLEDCKKNYVK